MLALSTESLHRKMEEKKYLITVTRQYKNINDNQLPFLKFDNSIRWGNGKMSSWDQSGRNKELSGLIG